MKKTILGMMAMLLLMVCVLSACGGGITKDDFGITVLGETIRIGQPMEDIDLQNQGGKFIDARITCMINNDGDVMGIQCFDETAQLISGVKIGDSVNKVLSGYGANLMYNNHKDEARYQLNYLFYEKDGKLIATSDKVQSDYFQYMNKDKLSDAEIAFLDANLEDIVQSDIYSLQFMIQDGKVAAYNISWQWQN